jgi:serine/threonine protein kinase
VDHRSDIFSFGAVLYEMVTGHPAFVRKTAADTMAAILKEDPPEPSTATIPPALARIVTHSLEKAREARFQSAHDLAFDLQSLVGTSGPNRRRRCAAPRWRTSSPCGRLAESVGGRCELADRRKAPACRSPAGQRPVRFTDWVERRR